MGVFAATVGFASLGLAQTPTPVRHGPGNGENKLVLQSRRQCGNAIRIMQAALPIYHGHRVRAIEITKIAIDEIRLGLLYDKRHENGAAPQSIEKRVAGIRNLSETGGNYDKKQVKQSNNKVRRAAAVLTRAQTNLTSAPKYYGGHRVNALKLVNMALGEINLALGNGTTP